MGRRVGGRNVSLGPSPGSSNGPGRRAPMSARPTLPHGTPRPKVTVLSLQDKRDRRERITMLTAHDYPGARAIEAAGIDAILVGDSLAMVALGHPDTLS